jgi:cytoskeletal protein CcmA (bactofilin family)
MSNEESATKTTIGPTIVIRGKLKSDEDLVVKGRIDAEITSSRALYIENSGIVKANVDVRSLRVNGILIGNITASEKAEIASDGRVVGDIKAPKLIIADGAAFRGRVEMSTFDERQGDSRAPAGTGDTRAPASTDDSAARTAARKPAPATADGDPQPRRAGKTPGSDGDGKRVATEASATPPDAGPKPGEPAGKPGTSSNT